MKSRVALVFLLHATIIAVESKRVYKTAVLAIQGIDTAWSQWNATFNEFFNERLGNEERSFVFEPYSFTQIPEIVRGGEADFVLVNPMLWSCITQELRFAPIATLVKNRQGTVLNQFGGQIITRAERDDITTMADLKDKVIAAVSLLGFAAGQLQWFEMAKAGLSPFNSPKKVMLAYSQKKIVQDVLSGAADVGFVRTDMVTGMLNNGEIVDKAAFKLINEIPDDSFPFPRSTPLYNEWSFGASPTVPDDLLSEVATALWSISSNSTYAMKGKYHHFQSPLPYGDEINLQSILGVMRADPVTFELSCAIDEDMYTMLSCGEGHIKLSRKEVETRCDSCPEGYDCLCTPCRQGYPEEVFVTTLDVKSVNNTELCHSMKHCGSTYVRDHFFDVRLVDNRGSLRANGGAVWKLIVGGAENEQLFASGVVDFAHGQSSVSFRVQVPARPNHFLLQITAKHTDQDLLTSPIILSAKSNPEPLLVHAAVLGLVGFASLLALVVVLRSLFRGRVVRYPLTPVKTVTLLECVGILLVTNSAVLTAMGYCAGAIISLVLGFHTSLSAKLALSRELVSLILSIRIQRKVISNLKIMQTLVLVALPDLILLVLFLLLIPLDQASQMDLDAEMIVVNIESHCHVTAANEDMAQGFLAGFLVTKLIQGVILQVLTRQSVSIPKRFNTVRAQNIHHWTFVGVILLTVVMFAVTGNLVGVSDKLGAVAALLAVDALVATYCTWQTSNSSKSQTSTLRSNSRVSVIDKKSATSAQVKPANAAEEKLDVESMSEEAILQKLNKATMERDALIANQLTAAEKTVQNFEQMLFKVRNRHLYSSCSNKSTTTTSQFEKH